jgi:hypothetical protein
VFFEVLTIKGNARIDLGWCTKVNLNSVFSNAEFGLKYLAYRKKLNPAQNPIAQNTPTSSINPTIK